MQTCVQLCRNNTQEPWGFRLQGGVDYSAPLSIKKVTEGTPSHGQLSSGDTILAVGASAAQQLTHNQAKALISRAGTVLQLTVIKHHGGGIDERMKSIKPKGPVKFSPWKANQ